MWRSAIIIFLLIISSSLRSQIIISNVSLTDTTQNIFYIGVENVLKISGKEYRPLSQSVAIKGGDVELIPRGIGTYILKVQKETDSCQMWIGTNKKIIFKKNFICRKVGDIVVRYGGLNDPIATVNQLLANPFLFY